MSLILKAAGIAREAHAGQIRKYSGDPYIFHPARVAGRVAILPGAREDLVAAAFLHDVLEDTEVTFEEIESAVGGVATLVRNLTNPATGSGTSREERKRRDRERLAGIPPELQRIKLVDRIDNLRDLERAPPEFKRLYARESLLLAEAIGSADPDLKAELEEAARGLLE